MPNKKEEDKLHDNISQYLQHQYPKVVFTTDASGVKLTMGQAISLKRKRSKHKICDMSIYKKTRNYCGLMLEVKKNWDAAYTKKNYIRTSQHIQEQYDTIVHLREEGYAALFVCSFEHAVQVIDKYMSGGKIEHLQDRRLDKNYR